ncbi:acyl carrier protein [Streptomyces sp. CA-181903]|uniref:acyl carrier protein n=1 Tax=Streptomyces sp. CA-181903 TaxID=3240055 RepID=UPI003D8B9302
MPENYEAVRSLLTDAFRIPEDVIRPEATLEQLELDSLALVELSLIIHERFGVNLGGERVPADTTVAEMAARLDALRHAAVGPS